MTTTIVRVPLTLATAIAFHVAMSPPSTSDSDTPSDRRRAVRAAARIITSMLTKGLYWSSALTDTLVLLAPHVPTSLPTLPPISIPPAGTLLSCIRPPTQWGLGLALRSSLSLSLPLPPSLPFVTIAGTTLALAGAFLRYRAYNALDQFYTCPNRGPGPCTPIPRGARGHAHALITTGPYAFVRHPGYAGLVLCTTGVALLQLDALMDKVHLGSGSSGVVSWGVSEGAGRCVGMRTMALFCAILSLVGAIRRIRDEEWALRARFQGEWEAWAARVRYRLVPGVY